MAGVKSIFRWDDRDAQRMLRRVVRRMDDLTPALKAFGEHMLVETDKRFTGQHAPDGTPWKPLAPATLRVKKTSKILQEQGRRGGLRGTIAYHVSDKRKLAVGTNKVYGAIHQLGGQAGRGRKVTIPARPYLGIVDADLAEFVAICRDWIEKGHA